jgi:phytoene synthase
MTSQLWAIIPGETTVSFEAALEATEEIIRSHSKTFYFATALLPHAERRAIRSLYAFCRASDDLVDCADTTRQDLDAWRAEVDLPAERQRNPILLSWAGMREKYGINRTYEEELLNGIEMDLAFHMYETWDELETYCYRVASTVGLLSMPIIGLAKGASFDHAARYAIKLGIALQLTNILRDVGEDAELGRVYFPKEDLERFGLSESDILRHVYDQRFIDLMRFEIARARRLYREALPGIALLGRHARPAVGAAALLYGAILNEIEAIKYRVHAHRAHLSGIKKICMVPVILLRVLTLRRPNP